MQQKQEKFLYFEGIQGKFRKIMKKHENLIKALKNEETLDDDIFFQKENSNLIRLT